MPDRRMLEFVVHEGAQSGAGRLAPWARRALTLRDAVARLEEAKEVLLGELCRFGDDLRRHPARLAVCEDEATARFEHLKIQLSLTTGPTPDGHAAHAATIRNAIVAVEPLLPSSGQLAAAAVAIRRMARVVEVALGVVALKLEAESASHPHGGTTHRRAQANEEHRSDE